MNLILHIIQIVFLSYLYVCMIDHNPTIQLMMILTEYLSLNADGSRANEREEREVINYVIHNIKPTDQTQAQSTVHSTVPFPALIPK